MTETIAAEDLGWMLAALERECPRTDLQANISDAEALQSGKQQVVGYHILSCDCQGTGRVPLFPGVRVRCSKGGEMVCSRCRDLGYTPSPDLAVWLEESLDVTQRWVWFSMKGKEHQCFLPHLHQAGTGRTWLAALLRALWKAVKEHRKYRVS